MTMVYALGLAVAVFIPLCLGYAPQRGLTTNTQRTITTNSKSFSSAGGARWNGQEFEGFEMKILGPVSTSAAAAAAMGSEIAVPCMGDFAEAPTDHDKEDMKRKANYNMNVGRAQEVLRRELPMIFETSNLDFSIFADQITVTDHRSNRASIPKSVYIGAVKSLRYASALSTLFPSMNVKKIEYIEEGSMIQCLVDVVLPDAVRLDGQQLWEGMMFFGLDEEGLINNHVFDQKISNFRPKPLAAIGSMPWLRPGQFGGEMVGSKAPGRLVYNVVGASGEADSIIKEMFEMSDSKSTWMELLSEVQEE